ncbi:MAG: hypothetical protein JST54_05905 [Deltaproteobacteria bacterium]|nr:hypothetical protein [Deltaproteobacteria bacterium]
MTRLRPAVLVLGLALAFAACSGGGSSSSSSGSVGSGTGTGTGNGTGNGTGSGNGAGGSTGQTGTSGLTGTSSGSAQQFCNSAEPELCTVFQTCGLIDPAVDCTNIFALLGGQCGEPGESYNATAGASCLEELQAGGSSLCDSLFSNNNSSSACNQVFQPGTPAGGSCTHDNECLPPAGGSGNGFCVKPPGSCSGVCQAGANVGDSCTNGVCLTGYCNFTTNVCTAFIAEGGDCSTNFEGCDPSIDHCTFSGTGETCSPLGGSGAPCTTSSDCAAGLACPAPPDGGFQSVCITAATDGQACTVQFGGQGNCATGLACLGGTCSTSSPGLGGRCGSYAYCNQGYCQNPTGSVGTCTAKLAQGAACTPSDECSGTLSCQNGTCQPLPSNGQPCLAVSNSQTCRGGDYCDSTGTCHIEGTQGAACDPTIQQACLTGYCDSTSHCAAFKTAGQACDPTRFECGHNNESCSFFADGGSLCTDGLCVAPDGGGQTVCMPACN